MVKLEAIRILRLLYKNELEFCDCTAPVEALSLIRDVLYLYEGEANNEGDINGIRDTLNSLDNKVSKLSTIFGINSTSSYINAISHIVLNLLNNIGLLEHKDSLINSKLTSHGKEVLEAFKLVDDLNVIFNPTLDNEF